MTSEIKLINIILLKDFGVTFIVYRRLISFINMILVTNFKDSWYG